MGTLLEVGAEHLVGAQWRGVAAKFRDATPGTTRLIEMTTMPAWSRRPGLSIEAAGGKKKREKKSPWLAADVGAEAAAAPHSWA